MSIVVSALVEKWKGFRMVGRRDGDVYWVRGKEENTRLTAGIRHLLFPRYQERLPIWCKL